MAEAAPPPPPSMARRLWALLDRLSSPTGVLLTAMLLLAFIPLTVPLYDPDFWWHLKAGQLIIQLGHLVHTDPFTYTVANHHWTMHEWLSEVAFAEMVRIGGIALFVVVLSFVTYAGILMIFAKAQLDHPMRLVAALGLILGVLVGDPIWGPRVQMETFTLTCATLLLAELHLRRPKSRITWVLVPMYLLWSNLHGGFVIGPILLIVILVAEAIANWVKWTDAAPPERLRSLALITVLATLVTLLNPNGPSIIFYAFETVASPAQQLFIQEWQSPNFHMWVIILWYAPMFLSLVLMIILNRHISARDAALFVVTLVLSLESVRNIALLVAAATPVWITQADMLMRRWRGQERGHARSRRGPPLRFRLGVLAVVGVLCLGLDANRVVTATTPQYNSLYYAVTYPVCAARWLGQDKEHLKIFNQYGDGGYLALTLSGQGDKIYIFGDAALMGDPLLYQYNKIQDLAPNWDQLLINSGTQVVLFVAGTPLATVLAKTPQWTLVYKDPRDVIFARTDLLPRLDLPSPATVPSNPNNVCHQLAVTPQSLVAPVSTSRRHPALQRAHSRLLWLIAGCIVSLFCTVHGITDPDFWWHLAIGRLIGQSGIPSTEPFAYGHAAFPWVGQQWLFEVMIAHLTAWGGAVPDMVVMGLVGAAAFFVAGLSGTRRGPVLGPVLAISVVVNAFVAAQVLGVRGQVITVLGVALVLLIVSRWREADQHTTGWCRGDRVVWLLPPLFLVWANFHAGFIAGLAIVFVMCILPRRPSWGIAGHRRPLFFALLLSLVATLITPAGIHLYPYIAQTFFNPTLTQLITEWQSPNFHNIWFKLLELEVIALVAFWCLDKGPPQWGDIVLAGCTFIATLDAQRNVAIFAIVATPQLARYGQAAWEQHHHRLHLHLRPLYAPTKTAALITGVGLLLCCLVGVGYSMKPLFVTAHNDPAAGFGWPEYAADYVAEHYPGQRIFSTYTDGGYLAYRFPHGRVVYIYGESAVFGDATLNQYIAIAYLDTDWEKTFTSLHAYHAILPVDAPDVAALRNLGWTLNCYDSASQSVVMSAGGPLPTASSPPGFKVKSLPAC